MSFSSPIFIPIIWSSNPEMNVLLPIVNSWFSALPPSNGLPSVNPSKSIVTISLSLTSLSSTVTILELCSAIWFISWSMSSSVTLYSIFFNGISLYLPSFTSGFVATIAVNIRSFPFSIWTTSICGLLATSILFSFISSS